MYSLLRLLVFNCNVFLWQAIGCGDAFRHAVICDLNPSFASAKEDTDLKDAAQLALCHAGTSKTRSLLSLSSSYVIVVAGLKRALALNAAVYILCGRVVQRFWKAHSGFKKTVEFTCGKLRLQLGTFEERECLLVFAPHPCTVLCACYVSLC